MTLFKANQKPHKEEHRQIQELGEQTERIAKTYLSMVSGAIAKLPDDCHKFPGRMVRITDWLAIGKTTRGGKTVHLFTLSVVVQKLDGTGDMEGKDGTFSVYGEDLIFGVKK